MVEHRILFLHRFEKMLADGRYGEAVLGTRVEQIHKIFNLQFLGSLRLEITALTCQLLPRFPKKTRSSVYGNDAVAIL